jgi:hypothetical protein
MAGTIDFGLLGVGEPSGYEQAQQRDVQRQLQQQQLQSGKFNLEKMQQDKEALAKLQEVMAQHGQTGDFEQSLKAMIASGIPHAMDVGIKGLQKLQEQKQFAMLMGGGESAAAPAVAPAAAAMPAPAVEPTNALATKYPDANTKSVMFNNNNLASDVINANQGQPTNALAPAAVAAAPAPVAVAAAPTIPAIDTAALERRKMGLLQLGTPAAIAGAQMLDKQIAEANKTEIIPPGATAFRGGKAIFTAPEKSPTQTEIIKEYEYAVKHDGYKGTLTQFKETFAKAGRTPAAAPPVTPVTIVDPNDPSKSKVVDARTNRVIGEGLKEGTGAQLSINDKQAREKAYPTATSAVKGFETKSDNFIRDLKALRDSKGLDEISGFVAGRVPAITNAGRKAQALYDKIVAKGGFQSLQDLRDMSKTGGALGNVSDREGKQLAASFAAIDRRQSADDIRAALDQAIAEVEGSKTRVRESYNSTYEYRNANSSAATPADGANKPTGKLPTPYSNAEKERRYQEWKAKQGSQ